MATYLTPKQMFREYQLDAHLVYEADRQEAESSAYKTMIEYADEASKYISMYTECIAEAYLDGCRKATALWESKGLKSVHAYAVLDDLVDFLLAFEETERD